MPAKPLPPASYLHECLDYDQVTGIFLWKTRPDTHFSSPGNALWWNTKYAHKAVGSLRKAKTRTYFTLALGGDVYQAQRIAWKMMTGRDPAHTIDHRDGNSLNNRWTNLREATSAQQEWNKRTPPGVSGRRGVFRGSKNRWRAEIKIDQKHHYLGSFRTIDEAAAAYEAKAREIAGDFYYDDRS